MVHARLEEYTNNLSETRINNENAREIKKIYQPEGKNHFESLPVTSMGKREKKVADGRNWMEAW